MPPLESQSATSIFWQCRYQEQEIGIVSKSMQPTDGWTTNNPNASAWLSVSKSDVDQFFESRWPHPLRHDWTRTNDGCYDSTVRDWNFLVMLLSLSTSIHFEMITQNNILPIELDPNHMKLDWVTFRTYLVLRTCHYVPSFVQISTFTFKGFSFEEDLLLLFKLFIHMDAIFHMLILIY